MRCRPRRHGLRRAARYSSVSRAPGNPRAGGIDSADVAHVSSCTCWASRSCHTPSAVSLQSHNRPHSSAPTPSPSPFAHSASPTSFSHHTVHSTRPVSVVLRRCARTQLSNRLRAASGRRRALQTTRTVTRLTSWSLVSLSYRQGRPYIGVVGEKLGPARAGEPNTLGADEGLPCRLRHMARR